MLDLLWPDRFKEQAQASLRQVLFELRTAAGSGAPLVEATRTAVALGPGIVECDVWSSSAAVLDRPRWRGASASLYRGPLLDGPPIGSEPFAQWVAIQRSRLEGRLESAVLDATAHDAGADEHQRAVPALQRLLALSPMCAQAMLRLMSIEVAAGRRQEALLQYERYAKRLKLEFDEEPPDELREAYETLKAAPQQTALVSASLRRPAYVHKDPWLRTRGDAPVVAVLPFRYEGPESSGAALATALSEDITMVLSGCRWFSVLSRSATHSVAAASPFIPRDFARLTGANYLIYGAIVERMDGLSLGIELADAETGHILWANRYALRAPTCISWAGEVCPVIVAALDPAVAEIERRTFAKPALAATGRPLPTSTRPRLPPLPRGAMGRGVAAFQSAIREDQPTRTPTPCWRSQSISPRRCNGTIAGGGTQEARRSAKRALEIDPSEPKGCNIMGQVLDWQGRHEEAIGYLERAVSLNPSFALSSTARSYHAVMTGAFDAAKTSSRRRCGCGWATPAWGCACHPRRSPICTSATARRRCRRRIGPCACSRRSGWAARFSLHAFPQMVTLRRRRKQPPTSGATIPALAPKNL